jgi:hypothetical protein
LLPKMPKSFPDPKAQNDLRFLEPPKKKNVCS